MAASLLNQRVVNSLARCAYLLRRISEGDHKALENARAAGDEAAALLREVRGSRPEWDTEEDADDAEEADPAGHHYACFGGEGG